MKLATIDFFFFKFAFIVFNPCFTTQVYHGIFTEFYNEFYSDVCGVHEEYLQIYFPRASSWSAWKMRLRKFVMCLCEIAEPRVGERFEDRRAVF